MVLLSARRQDNQFNTIINCSPYLQVDYLQIKQQESVTRITLQAQPIFTPNHVSLHKYTIRPYKYTTALDLVPSTSFYVTQNSLENTNNSLFAKLNDKFYKQDEKMESINAIIVNHDAKIDEKIEKHPQPMSLYITDISSKQSDQAKLLSTL